MAEKLKLTLNGSEVRGVLLRFENLGTSPLAVIRSHRPGFYASYEAQLRDAAGDVQWETVPMLECGTPYPLTADGLVVLPPGGTHEAAVDTRGYELPPGRYTLQVTYRTNKHWLDLVTTDPPGFELVARGEWTSNVLDVLSR
ncbi:MAG TPA: hypothetical protein VF950_30745 [Planctomycetota bacterium]